MKKIFYMFIALMFAIPTFASAASFSFSPNTGSYTVGDNINVAVYVNPSAGESITTTKMSLLFPAADLEVVSFVLDSGWIALTQSGYDLVDNTNGKLIKTGGFPPKVQAQKKFGTIVFRAKNSGLAAVNTDTGSLLLDTTNTNKYVSSVGATFTLSAKVITPEVKEEVLPNTSVKNTPVKTNIQNNLQQREAEATTPVVETEEQLELENELDLQATALGVSEDSFDFRWLLVLGIAVLLGLGMYARSYFTKNKN